MANTKSVLGLVLRPGSYSDRWVERCCQERISFTTVNPFDPEFFAHAKGVKALAWHWDLGDPKAAGIARQVILALEFAGTPVFPNYASCWHYDDKIGQSYLLKVIEAPIPRSFVFVDLRDALKWLKSAELPIVFKLRAGAGSSNVRLVSDLSEARSLCRQAFGRGFVKLPSYFSDARTKVSLLTSWGQAMQKARRAPIAVATAAKARWSGPRESGYVLFQEFMPGNQGDTAAV